MTEPSAGLRQASLRQFRVDGPAGALGLAVNYLMTKPAFANLPFGHWARVLAGQINRKHYFFVVDQNDVIQGFVGWALSDEAVAEQWAANQRGLSFEESKAGDCFLINAWAADTPAAHQFILQNLRKEVVGKKTIYFKRHYKDGTVRPSRVAVNEFITKHIADRDMLEAVGGTT